MRSMENLEKYGIKPLTLEEEWNYPYNAKLTRNNKIKIIDRCETIRNLVETIECRAKAAPELDDDEHAEIIQKLANLVLEARFALESACQSDRMLANHHSHR